MEIILMRPGAGNMKDVALKIPNQDGSSDVIYETKTGRFILVMNCSNVDWNVSVEELRG
jgi:hypothetical protein